MKLRIVERKIYDCYVILDDGSEYDIDQLLNLFENIVMDEADEYDSRNTRFLLENNYIKKSKSYYAVERHESDLSPYDITDEGKIFYHELQEISRYSNWIL